MLLFKTLGVIYKKNHAKVGINCEKQGDYFIKWSKK